jgi:hypothetical protein
VLCLDAPLAAAGPRAVATLLKPVDDVLHVLPRLFARLLRLRSG